MAFLVWKKENFITFAPRFMQSLIRRVTDNIANY